VLTVILLPAFILIGIDYFTLSDSWLFYGWDMFVKSDKKPPSSITLSSGKQIPSGQGIFPNSPYFITKGWFVLFASDWENHLKEIRGKPDIHALEIGSYEGFSAIWQLEHILTDSTSTITCVDIFNEKEIEDRFDHKILKQQVLHIR
jgi:hypothetical protein